VSQEFSEIPIQLIRVDGGTQPRAALDFDAVDDYADAMRIGVTFPPVTVFYDGESYWLGDGFHRIKAALEIETEVIRAEVRQGTLEDAQWFSFSANRSNGLRRTNEDKQRAVKAALLHPQGAGKSDRDIAKHVGVDSETVRNWRNKLTASSEIRKIDTRTVSRNGTTYQQNTTNIGKSPTDHRPPPGFDFAEYESDSSSAATSACMGDGKATPDGREMPAQRPSVVAPSPITIQRPVAFESLRSIADTDPQVLIRWLEQEQWPVPAIQILERANANIYEVLARQGACQDYVTADSDHSAV
jgi:hypothetical protein